MLLCAFAHEKSPHPFLTRYHSDYSTRRLSGTASDDITTYTGIPLNFRADTLCVTTTPIVDATTVDSTIASQEFSFIIQVINSLESDTESRQLFSLDNELPDDDESRILIECGRSAYATDAGSTISCSIQLGANSPTTVSFTAQAKASEMVSIYVAYSVASEEFYQVLKIEDQSLEPVKTTVPAYSGTYKFPSRVTMGASTSDVSVCAKGLLLLKARMYPQNYFSDQMLSSANFNKLFQDAPKQELVILPADNSEDPAYIRGYVQFGTPSTILIGLSTTSSESQPKLKNDPPVFSFRINRGEDGTMLNTDVLSVASSLDLSNSLISAQFVKGGADNSAVLLQRYVRSLDKVDFTVAYDFFNQRFLLVFNDVQYNTPVNEIEGPLSEPKLFHIHINKQTFKQQTTVTFIDPANNKNISHTFDSVLHSEPGMVYDYYVGEKIPTLGVFVKNSDSPVSDYKLMNLAILTGHFELDVADSCPTGCTSCASFGSSPVQCFSCDSTSNYYLELPTATCSSVACDNKDDICTLCNIDNCLTCREGGLTCFNCLWGYTLNGDATACQESCTNSSLTRCAVCDDSHCYKCTEGNYVLKQRLCV